MFSRNFQNCERSCPLLKLLLIFMVPTLGLQTATRCLAADRWEILLTEANRVSAQAHTLPEKIQAGQDSAIAIARQALRVVEHESPVDSLAIGEILNNIGDYCFLRGDLHPADSVWRLAVDINSRLAGDSADLAYATLFRIGATFGDQESSHTGGSVHQHALNLVHTLTRSNSPSDIRILSQFAEVVVRLQMLDLFHGVQERIVSIWRQFPGDDPRWVIRALVFLGERDSKRPRSNVQSAKEHQRQAIAYGEEALSLAKHYYGSNDTLYAFVANRLGDYYDRSGELDRTVDLWRQAWEINRKSFPEEHIEYQGSNHRMAATYFYRGRYAEAKRMYADAVRLRIATQGAGHPEVAFMYNGLGMVYHDIGDYIGADTCYHHALRIREAALEQVPSDIAQSLLLIGDLRFDQGVYPQAEEAYRRALEIREESLGTEHGYVANCHRRLAGLFITWGKLNEAEDRLRRAQAKSRDFYGENHPTTVDYLLDLGRVFLLANKLAKADSIVSQCRTLVEQNEHLGLNLHSRILHMLSTIRLAQERFAEATALLEAAIVEREGSTGQCENDLVPLLIDLAVCHIRQNQLDEAEIQLARVLTIERSIAMPDLPVFDRAYTTMATLHGSKEWQQRRVCEGF